MVKKATEPEESGNESQEGDESGAGEKSDTNVAESFAQEIARMREEWAQVKQVLQGSITSDEHATRRSDATQAQAGATSETDSGPSESQPDKSTTKPVEKRPESGHWYWRKRGG